jgi:uncharacterized protein
MVNTPETKFIVDKMLGRLAVWLRILGYDTQLHHGPDRHDLIWRSLKENRIIITRDTHITHRHVLRFIFIKSDLIREQVKQLLQEYPSEIQIIKERLFTRCTLCNNLVTGIAREQVQGRVAPYIYNSTEKFAYCQKCDKIYWQGTHWEKLLKDLQSMDVHHESNGAHKKNASLPSGPPDRAKR